MLRLLSVIALFVSLPAFAAERPNILLIMADDMGFSDLGCYGWEIATPNLDIPEYQGFLNRNCRTLAEVLKSAGYQTFMAGKWHIGLAPGQRPPDRGFDRFYGIHGGGSSFFFPRSGQIMVDRKPLDPLPDKFYTTSAGPTQCVAAIG